AVFHDLQHKRHPEHFRWFDLPFWRLLLFASVRRSTILIAVSEATKSDLMRFYGVSSEKVRVIGHGVDPEMFGLAHLCRAEPPYLLAVSTLHPHKNLERLLRAFAEFHRARPDFRLVVAGLRGFHAERLENLRTSLNLAGVVRFAGWIPREELYDLFANASAFIYPSTFEGFGMPVIEALAAGLPTACSNIEPLATLAGDAALLFDPGSDPAIHDALVRIASDDSLRRRLAAAGPVRAAPFAWENSARLTLEALREASDFGALC
nr:glycosyltransferase family 4 protein [Acidobacteriota bacterium]